MRNVGWEVPLDPCPRCGKSPRKTGEDGCLGHLPGVVSACCGHGIGPGYIIFENGVQLEFYLIREPTLGTPSKECR